MAGSGWDGRGFARLARRVRNAASPETYNRLKKAIAAEAVTQVQLGFREGRDPYGNPWSPPKFRIGKPLLDTGRLRSSFAAQITPTGFRIGSNVKYANVHQYGAVIRPKAARALRFPLGKGKGAKIAFAQKVTIPQRQMVPERGRLGRIWGRAFKAVYQRELRRILSR